MTTILFTNKFLEIKERDGYYFLHEKRIKGRAIALVPFKKSDDNLLYLARMEICPAHNLEFGLYSITGGIEESETPAESAVRELAEESGFEVLQSDLIYLGQVRPSKQSDTITDVFSVDVTDLQAKNINGDGSRWEQNATVRWVTYSEGLNIIDPLFIVGMSRLMEKLNGSKS